jgi:hypothetical protein
MDFYRTQKINPRKILKDQIFQTHILKYLIKAILSVAEGGLWLVAGDLSSVPDQDNAIKCFYPI